MVQGVSTAFEKLTPREREILRLVAGHLQSKEIARALGLSPKTVEMHVLSARRRLSGLSRRDAALAFVAWEGGDPGNDYRKQPDDLAALAGLPPSEREAGSGDARPRPEFSNPSTRGEHDRLRGQLGVAGGVPDLAGGHAGARRPGAGDGVGAAQGPGDWRAVFADLVEGPGGDGVPDGRPAARRVNGRANGRDWRHELTNVQWLGLILVVTAVTAVLLAVTTIGLHQFIKAVERIMAPHYS
jgi:DNA-binding CsgD family transcriptional regulator